MMDDIRRRILIKRFLVLPMLILMLLIILLVFGSSWFTASSNYRISCLDEGWSIFRGGKVITNASLSDYKVGSSKAGERITISNTLNVPEHTTLMFRSKHEAVDMYVDGRRVYSHGRDYLEEGRFIPKRYNLINLNPKAATHNIMITYTMGEDDSVRKISPIFYGRRSDLIRAFFSYHRISMFIGSFLVIYSCLLCSLWIFMSLNRRDAAQIYYGAFFSMLLGCYILSKNDILWFIGNHEMLFSLMEYICVCLMPLAFTILFHSINHNELLKFQKSILKINIVLPIIIFIMHFSGIIHINRFREIVGIISFAEIILILPSLVGALKKQFKQNLETDYYAGLDADYYLIFGFFSLVISTLIEMIMVLSFNVNSDFTDKKLFPTVDSLEFGMLIFMACHFVYYLMNGINHMSADMIKAQLEGLAFTDTLTGLMNRAACAEYFATVGEEYALVSLDLDRLKQVNDTLGHSEGDRMIKTFAQLLKKTFSGAAILARNGGDEFVAVFENSSPEEIEKCIDNLNEEMKIFNEKKDTFTLSASAGYAFASEVEGKKVHDVFYLADQRMYKVKEAHHG